MFIFSIKVVGQNIQSDVIMQSLNTTGNEATGSSGTVAYSIGQVFYTYIEDSIYTVGQGVQQGEVEILTTSWNGIAWSNGIPTTKTSAIISGNYNVDANIDALSLTVNNNANVIIPSGYFVTLDGPIEVSSGIFTLDNDASLIQSSNVINLGNITVNRNSSALLRLDYSLWSSPVVNSSYYFQTFSPATSINRFYNYNSLTNLYNTILNPSETNFKTGQGYLIRMPNDASSIIRTIYSGTFTGVPNNGIISVALTNGGDGKRFNLVGNPYPSPISLTKFVVDNSFNITVALYFWRKTNNANSPSYCTWVSGTFIYNGESQVVNPNDIIQTGQGFFVEALGSATTVTFNNSQRTTTKTNQFFKTKLIEKSTIWLNATNTEGAFSQMAVGYITDATLDIDKYDGKYYNDGVISLNSFLNNTDYVIQGRPLPFDVTDEVPLSFKVTSSGNYTIAIDHVDGLFSQSQDIILKDNEQGTETNLKIDSYNFVAVAGTTNTRFSLIYQKTLGTTKYSLDKNLVFYKKNENIFIKSNDSPIDNIKVFDISGRLLLEKTKLNKNEISIQTLKYLGKVLIFEIVLENQLVVIKKIVI